MPKTPLERVTLEGDYVRLVPVRREHIDLLLATALDEDLWRWTPSGIASRADFEAYVDDALERWAAGDALPFTTTVRATGEPVGMTRLANIDLANRRAEIGWTWVGRPWQRTAVNTEAKLLMLAHAFDALGCHRVELKTDVLNTRSRNAILRLGAKEEGVLRKHVVTSSGRVRDTMYFSVIDTEWPEVAATLRARLARGAAASGVTSASREQPGGLDRLEGAR